MPVHRQLLCCRLMDAMLVGVLAHGFPRTCPQPTSRSGYAISRCDEIQDKQYECDDATCLQVAQPLPLVHDGAALVVVHECVRIRGPMSRVSVGFGVWVAGVGAVGVEAAWQGDGDAAAWARETKVGPDAGTSLASGDFDAAGHGTRRHKGRKGSTV